MFAAPDGASLDAGADYFVVISCTAGVTGNCLNIRRTGAGAEDSGGAAGWSIADQPFGRSGSIWVNQGSNPLKIRVRGSAQPVPNVAPTFTEGDSATRDVTEDTGNTAGSVRNVGTAVTATDGNTGDTLRYDVSGGTDRAAFNQTFAVNTSTGQISTKSGVVVDREAKSSYAVTLRVRDGSGASDTISLTVNVDNVAEKPLAPGTPTVAAKATSPHDTITVSWTAPDNTGRPAISGYKVQYKLSTSSGYTTQAHPGTTTTAEIDGLTPESSYEVRVLATNSDGDGPASDVGTASTGLAEGTTILLVGNIGQGTDGWKSARTNRWLAQAFSTGTHAAGYKVHTVHADLRGATFASTTSVRADVYTASGGNPGIRLFTLTNPTLTPSTSGVQTFSAPEVAGLAPNTTYFVVFSCAEAVTTTCLSLHQTGSPGTGEDNGGAAGWSISDRLHELDSNAGWSTDAPPFRIRVRGSTRTGGANAVPTFSDGPTATRSIAEHVGGAAGPVRVVGAPVAATDGDNDTLTYSVAGGADRAAFNAAFTLDSATGQISTKSNALLDFEAAKKSWTVTLAVIDGSGGLDTVAVTISLTNEAEKPSKRPAPTVTAKAGTSDTITVTWTAPGNRGRPAITGYKVQYKLTSADDSAYESHTLTGLATATTTEIDGLMKGASYDVQVLATNADGDGPWSDAGTGSTGTADPLVSNLGQTASVRSGVSATRRFAQAFTTGANAAGYSLASVELDLIAEAATSADNVVVEVFSASGANPGSLLFTLIDPTLDGSSSGPQTFTAPDDASTLAASTTYFVVLACAESYTGPGACLAPRRTDATAQDSGGAAGWSIGDQIHRQDPPAAWETRPKPFKIRISGSARSGAANQAASGAPTITGTAQVDQQLTAATGGITDGNGLDNVTWSYQWIRVASDNTETNIGTGSTYTIVQADLGSTIKVTVTFTDDDGNRESLTSTATSAVAAAANRDATGAPTITGTAQVDQTLTAVTTGIADADGTGTFSYQWIRVASNNNETNIGTGSSYTVVQADVGSTIKVTVSFTDGRGNAESLTSAATGAVAAAANRVATGTPTITGTAEVGSQLTADTSGIADADGLGTFAYQWVRVASGGSQSNIGTGASTYTVAQADVGSTIKVAVSFTDGRGNAEGPLTSTATAAVVLPNAAPTYDDTTSAYNTAENTRTVATLTASDADNVDSVTGYTLGGADAGKFSITDAGLLRFKTAPNHESPTDAASTDPSDVAGNNVYVVTVTVASGAGDRERTASLALKVTVTDANEPPDTPTAPIVAPKVGSTTGTITVSWTAPSTAGRPAITGYSVEYKLDSAADYTSHAHADTTTSTDIANLTAGATYDVRILATNDEGNSAWSADGTGKASDPSTETLLVVKNLGQTTGDTLDAVTPANPQAQQFAIGSNTAGYSLADVTLDIGQITAPSQITVKIHLTAANGSPGAALFTLAKPALTTSSTGLHTFTAPAGSRLRPSRSYYVVVSCAGGGGCVRLRSTTSFDEDSGAAAGWSIQNAHRRFTVSWVTVTEPFKIRVRATARTAATNAAASGAPTISGTAQVGHTLNASVGTIDDSNGLTGPAYSYQWIAVDTNGIETNRGTAATYGPVAADVGKTLKVRLSFTDDDGYSESRTSAATTAVLATTPIRVANVRAEGGPRDQVNLGWSTVNDATGYKVQWKSGSQDWDATDRQATVTGTSHTISGLTQGTEYTVRMAATKTSAPDGAWSNTRDATPYWTAVLVVGPVDTSDPRLFTGYDETTGSLWPTALDYHGTSHEVTRVRYRGDNRKVQFKRATQGSISDFFRLCMDGVALSSALYLTGSASGFTAAGEVPEDFSWSAGDKADVALIRSTEDCPAASDLTTTLTGPSNFTNRDSFTVSVAFSESVSGLTAKDFVVSEATATLTGSAMSWSLEVTPTTGDDITVALPIGAAHNSDGALTASALQTVPAANVDPVFEGSTTAFNVAENTATTTAVTTLTATDADTADTARSYALSGADAGAFAISDAGVLTFKAAPNYESPTDAASTTPANAAGNNEYVVTVTVTSGTEGRARTAERTLTVTVTDVAEPPPKPTALTVTAKADTTDTLTVSWSAPDTAGRPDITGYTVEYKLTSDADTEYAAHSHTGTGTSTDITMLTAGTSYDVRVLATNDEGNSPWSDEVAGSTTAAALAQVTGVSVTGGVNLLDVSWTAVTEASGYKVQWKSGTESYDATNRQAVVSSTATSYAIPGLTQGTEYTVRVAATKAGASDGEWSTEDKGIPIWVGVLIVGRWSEASVDTFGFNTAQSQGSIVPSTVAYKGSSHEIQEIRDRKEGSDRRTFDLAETGSVTESLKLCFDGASAGTSQYLQGRFHDFDDISLSWSAGDKVDVALVAADESCPTSGVTTMVTAPATIDSHDAFTVGLTFGESVTGLTADDFRVSSRATVGR